VQLASKSARQLGKLQLVEVDVFVEVEVLVLMTVLVEVEVWVPVPVPESDEPPSQPTTSDAMPTAKNVPNVRMCSPLGSITAIHNASDMIEHYASSGQALTSEATN